MNVQEFTLNKGKLVICLSGLFCLYAVYAAVSDFKLPGKAEALEPVDPIVELDPVNIQLLTKTHLFGQPPQVKVVSTKSPVNNSKRNNKTTIQQRKAHMKTNQKNNTGKPIKINVTVTGLLASTDDNYAAAILKVDNKSEKLYKVGEFLGKSEVKLQSVGSESIVIDNNGNAQTITMKRPGLENSKNAGNNRRTNQINNQIPELASGLELPEELQSLNQVSAGAYTPPAPEASEFNVPSISEELADEHHEDIQSELESETASGPSFQMPVF